MITLKEALKLNQKQLEDLKKELLIKIEKKKELNAYISTQSLTKGVPILVKDNIQVKDWPVTCGSNILQGYVAPYSATVIKNMVNANLTPFGRANMDEFAMGSTTQNSFYGKTKNPINSNYIPGGSSGGSAAAVGGGIAVAALGSDTGGSIRQPAAFCGVVGMKPTYGRVSRYGLSAHGSSLDQIGPITQNVEDAAILYDIISGFDKNDSTSFGGNYERITPKLNSSRKLTIAILPNYLKKASDDVKKAYEKAIMLLKSSGHTIVEKELMDPKYSISAYYITATAEAATNLARYDGIRYGNQTKEPKNLKELFIKTRSKGFANEVKRRILIGNFVLSSGYYDAYYVKAQKIRTKIQKDYNKVFNDADLILSPVTPSTAWKANEELDVLKTYLLDMYTISVNLAGLPALSLPVLVAKNGLPVGLQFIANAYEEQKLFDASLSLEYALKLSQ